MEKKLWLAVTVGAMLFGAFFYVGQRVMQELESRYRVSELQRNMRAADESRAIGMLRVFNTALTTYKSRHGKLPDELNALGREDLVSPGYEYDARRYVIEYLPEGEKYILRATPTTDARRAFYTDQTTVIRATRESREAQASDPPI